MEPTEEMKGMARRIAGEKSKSHGDGRGLDFQLAYAAALAAIMETSEMAAAHLDQRAELGSGFGDLGFAARIDAKAIRSGDHLKDSNHV